MKTLMMLMAQYEKAVIPLEEICVKYFGVKIEEARKRAARSDLPVVCIRFGSQRSEWFIRTEDLANHIDEVAIEQKVVWNKMNGV